MQVANGTLLPIVAVFLIYVVDDRDILGLYANLTLQNVVGELVTLAVVWLGLRTLYTVTTDMKVFWWVRRRESASMSAACSPT